jgi:hypothetical protein
MKAYGRVKAYLEKLDAEDRFPHTIYNGLIVKTKNKVFYNEPICM